MTNVRVLLPLIVLFACAATPSRSNSLPTDPSLPAAAEAQGIAFLHLRLHPAKVELLGITITPGRLKPAPEHPGNRILLQVRSRAGDLLWEGTVEDPQVERIESAEDERGRRANKVVEHASREVTTRVPFFEEGQEVRIWRVAPGKDASAHQKLLGTFQLRK